MPPAFFMPQFKPFLGCSKSATQTVSFLTTVSFLELSFSGFQVLQFSHKRKRRGEKYKTMDMKKLCRLLLEDDEIKTIPLEYVIRVVAVVFEIINSGECYYENECD